MKLVIKNGSRLQFNSAKRGDACWVKSSSIVIENGLITALDTPNAEQGATQVIDASDRFVIPGLIDLSVALPEPGYTTKGSINSETKAAIAGGVTSVYCSPQTDPVNDSPAVTKLILEKAHATEACRVYPLGALTQELKGENLAEYAALKDAGCVALSNVYNPLKNLSITKRCFEYAKTHDLSVFVNPIEPSLHNGVMHSGEVSTTIGLPGISSLAETIAVSQLIKLAESTGVHLHLSQLSTSDAVVQLRDAKARGINITADVAIQNLLFTDEKIENFNSMYRCLPPLRSELDRQALITGINDGVIDTITSAHRPHEAAAKQAPFAETEPGMSNIELLLPMARLLDDAGSVELISFIDAMTRGASAITGLTSPDISEGGIADLCIIDPSKSKTVSPETLVSEGKNTPLMGNTLKTWVQSTIVAGRVVYPIK